MLVLTLELKIITIQIDWLIVLQKDRSDQQIDSEQTQNYAIKELESKRMFEFSPAIFLSTFHS